MKTEAGFSLLEVVVALAILSLGFVTVLQLFSGGVRSMDLSEQYLKAVTLAHSKLNELELAEFNLAGTVGIFQGEDHYRWEVNVTPYPSALNNEENHIHLQEVALTVFWEDRGQGKEVRLTTLKLAGTSVPAPDHLLKSIFQGGVNPQTPPQEATAPAAASPASPTVTGNISGAATSSHVCGTFTGGNLALGAP